MADSKTVTRIDKAVIKGKLARTSEGYLKGDAVIARTGILEYYENGQIVKELVLPDELSKNDSLETLKMKPVTNGHPSVKMLDAKTVKQYQVGHTGESVRVDAGLLLNSIIITDEATVREIEAGKRELSAGYHCDLIEENGVWNGQRYDRIQVNRRYNHVAICDLSRAGEVTKLRLDSANVYEVGQPDYNEKSLEEGSWRKELGSLTDGCLVFLTDLAYVQKHYNREYEGGHSYAYDYIGSKEKPEIWIPMGDSIAGTRLDLTHEIIEYYCMRYQGMTYEKAHDEALKIETIIQSVDPMAIPATEKTGSESAGENKADSHKTNNQQRSDGMEKINLDGIQYDAAPEVVKHIEKLTAANTKLTADHKVALDSLTADRDTFKDKLDKADAEIKSFPAKIKAAVDARLALVSKVTPHLDKADLEKIDSISDTDLKKALVVKAFPKADVKDVSDVYLQARYDAALEVLADKKHDDSMANQRRNANGEPADKEDGCDKGMKKDKTKEDVESEVTNRWKKTSNREAVMGSK